MQKKKETKRNKETERNKETPKLKSSMTSISSPESLFLEAPLVRQAEGELKNSINNIA